MRESSNSKINQQKSKNIDYSKKFVSNWTRFVKKMVQSNKNECNWNGVSENILLEDQSTPLFK